MAAETLTLLIEQAQTGNTGARDAIYRLAFQRLRRIAGSLMRRERAGHTLQPTALVNEAFLKLNRLQVRILGDDHFYRVAARAMSQVLVDHARGRRPAIPLESVPNLLESRDCSREMTLAARLAFEKLRKLDATAAATVWLRCVEGMTLEELCRAQGRPMWRVRADYDYGLEWIAARLGAHR
jgi:RNA polymerase sigma factor (TIGR02999 family)